MEGMDKRYLRSQDQCANQNPLACPSFVSYFELGSDPFKVHERDEDDRNLNA